MDLFTESYNWDKPVRSIGVRACNLTLEGDTQISFLPEHISEQKQNDLERAMDDIRRRFGHFAVQRGMMLQDNGFEYSAADLAL